MLWINLFILFWAQAESEHRIIGGKKAEPGEFPYLAFIDIEGIAGCTGALISPEWVLTAAHCTEGSLKVIAGHSNRESSNAQQRKVIKVINHPKYSESILGVYDYALVKVEAFNMSSETIGILKLSGDGWPQDQQDSRKCTAVGWGLTSKYRAPLNLRHINVTAMHGSGLCPCFTHPFFAKHILCLKIEVGNNICFGDSGGPLICDGEGVGVAHAMMYTNMCDPWSTEETEELCGGDKSSGTYMYLCPVLGWIREHVSSVPPVPVSCSADKFYKSITLLYFVYSLIYLIN